MSPEEVYSEIIRDTQSLFSKAQAHAVLFQKEMLRKGLKREVRTLQYETPHHNKWTLLLRVFPEAIQKIFYLETEDNIGHIAFLINFKVGVGVNEVVKYNTHFFKRYRERAHPDIVKTSELVKCFFNHNLDMDIGETEKLPDGSSLVNYIYPEGIGIGWHLEERKFVHMKTFLPNNMLNKTQQSLVDHIQQNNDEEAFITHVDIKHLRNKF